MDIKELFSHLFPHTRLNKSLRVLVTVDTIMIFVLGLFVPFYAVFVRNIGGTIAFAGLSWAIYAIVAGVLTLLFTNWELKVKEQELLLMLGYAIRGFVFLSYAFMNSMGQLIFTQILWGIAFAIGVPAFDAIYSKHTTDGDRIVQWGGREGLAAIATGLAALVGGILIQTLGYASVFMGMAIISFLLAIYVWRLPRELL